MAQFFELIAFCPSDAPKFAASQVDKSTAKIGKKYFMAAPPLKGDRKRPELLELKIIKYRN